MKNRLITMIRIVLIVGATVFCCIGILYVLDNGITDGIFADWFNWTFIIETNKSYKGIPGNVVQTELDWYRLKKFILFLFVVTIVAVDLLCCLIYYWSAKRKSEQIMSNISNAMRLVILSDKEIPVLPKEYREFENQLKQLKEAEQRNRQLVGTEMQRKNDLITYLAHDLKTPLASVIGYLSLLDEAPDIPPEQKVKYVGIALKKAYRLEELINEFFEITRFNLQSIVLNKGKLNLAFMLQQMADEFYPILAPQGKKADVDAPEDITLFGDADKLARVFNNILKNAIAYSYENSVIDICAVRQGDNVMITFTNEGNPIPQQKLDTIFEKFYRLDSSRSTNTGGAGLGLAIAKEIVTAHGGTIAVVSSQEHTVFTVKLPA